MARSSRRASTSTASRSSRAGCALLASGGLHVEPIGTAGARAFLLRQPDFFLGDLSEMSEGRDPAGAAPSAAGNVNYEVDPSLAGETVTLWWGLFDHEFDVAEILCRQLRRRAAEI